jgi:hypothetical protein
MCSDARIEDVKSEIGEFIGDWAIWRLRDREPSRRQQEDFDSQSRDQPSSMDRQFQISNRQSGRLWQLYW